MGCLWIILVIQTKNTSVFSNKYKCFLSNSQVKTFGFTCVSNWSKGSELILNGLVNHYLVK